MKSFVVFSDDWAVHPSSCQHIFKQIAAEYPVVWVNTVGMRTPTFSFFDFKKIVFKLKNMFSKSTINNVVTDESLNVSVLQPFMLPFMRWSLVRFINKVSVSYVVGQKLKGLGLSKPTVVVTAPNAVDYVDSFSSDKIVYYCVDDFSEWPGLDKSLVKQMEDRLIERADIHIATSKMLVNRIGRFGKNVESLSHGVDVDNFSVKPESEHNLLTEIPKPRIGYFGLFDRRSDLNLLLTLANLMPNVSFVITGNTQVDISSLKKCSNIFFTGAVPYEELAQIAYGFNICMLPYVVGPMTDSIQPLKFKEYIATGKPIISTPIKEAERFKDYIHIAESTKEWLCFVDILLNDSTDVLSDKKIDFLKNETWSVKAKLFLDYCCK